MLQNKYNYFVFIVLVNKLYFIAHCLDIVDKHTFGIKRAIKLLDNYSIGLYIFILTLTLITKV